MQNAREDKVQGPPVSLLEEDKDELRHQGLGRTWMATRPGASRDGVAVKAPDPLPYVLMAGTSLH